MNKSFLPTSNLLKISHFSAHSELLKILHFSAQPGPVKNFTFFFAHPGGQKM